MHREYDPLYPPLHFGRGVVRLYLGTRLRRAGPPQPQTRRGTDGRGIYGRHRRAVQHQAPLRLAERHYQHYRPRFRVTRDRAGVPIVPLGRQPSRRPIPRGPAPPAPASAYN